MVVEVLGRTAPIETTCREVEPPVHVDRDRALPCFAERRFEPGRHSALAAPVDPADPDQQRPGRGGPTGALENLLRRFLQIAHLLVSCDDLERRYGSMD